MVDEPEIQISGRDVYEAANKLIAKITRKYNISLETINS